jgi:anti-sigma B factor antagonist
MVDPEPGLKPVPWRLEVERSGAVATVVVSGELDLLVASDLQRVIDGLLDDGVRRLVLDLRGLEFMDSSGIAVACRLHARARREGVEAVLVRGAPPIQRVFTIAGVEDQFAFVDIADGRPAADAANGRV